MPQTAEGKFIKAINKGLLKIFSKMGISTVQSYCGAQIFEAIGLNHDIDRPVLHRHAVARGRHRDPRRSAKKRCGGIAWPTSRRPSGSSISAARFTIASRVNITIGTRTPSTSCSMRRSRMIRRPLPSFRSSSTTRAGGGRTCAACSTSSSCPTPIPLEEVEPVEDIVKRFTTGAMSFGSISKEAHETLAIAMNRIGGKSNTGEGGEDPERFKPLAERRFARTATSSRWRRRDSA